MNSSLYITRVAHNYASILPVTVFNYLSPINLTLAVYILVQNCIIIYDYSKDWRKLSCQLFILIAAVDIGSASSELARGTVALLCLNDESMRMSPWIFVSYLSIGLVCYVTSTFFGLVLAVVKTINIVNPFYRIHGRALRVFLAIFPSIGLVLTVTDIWSTTRYYDKHTDHSCAFYGPWLAYFEDVRAVGQSTLWVILRHFKYNIEKSVMANALSIVLVVLEFCIPCLVVFVCTIIQIVHIRKSLGQSADPQQNAANHITVTIFLITLLYLVSVMVYSACLLVEYCYYELRSYTGDGSVLLSFNNSYSIYNGAEMVGKFTLPMINAALFPTIVILRKSELKERYKGYVLAILRFPGKVFNRVRH